MLFGQSRAVLIQRQLQKAPQDSIKARLSAELAVELRFSQPKTSLDLATTAIFLASPLQLNKIIASAYRTKAYSYVALSNTISSLASYDSAIYYANKSGDIALKLSIINNKAGVFGDLGDFDKAIEIYSAGLEIAKKENNPRLMGVFYNNIADAYQNIGGNSLKVQQYYKLALENSIKSQNWPSAGLNYANLAHEYALQDEKVEAEVALKNAKSMLAKTAYGTYIFAAINNEISNTYELLKNHHSAIQHALISLRILDSLKMDNNTLRPLQVLANSEFELNGVSKSKSYGLKLLEVAQKMNAKVYIKEAYKVLSAVAKKEGNLALALDYFEKYKSWNDSVFQLDKLNNIKKLEFKSDLLKQDLELKYGLTLKQKENAQLAEDNRNLKRGLIAGSLVFVVLFTLGLLLYKSSKNKLALQSELIEKNNVVLKQASEKDVLIQEIHHRVKNNLTMLQSLFFLQAKSTDNEDLRLALAESQTRLLSMAVVHNHLYENEGDGGLEVVAFVQTLLHDISETFVNTKHKPVSFFVTGSDVEIGIKLAIPVGLILNELITNSLKYAFNHVDSGRIDVVVSHTGSMLNIAYSDNGPGLDKEFDLSSAGFGFKILKLLTKQLKANISYSKGSDFSKFELNIPME
jgi:two-component sensor histidine kinase